MDCCQDYFKIDGDELLIPIFLPYPKGDGLEEKAW